MCGIFGYLQRKGKEEPIRACLEGLKLLEYRGYDSAGIASIQNSKILSFKQVGKVAELDNILPKKHFNTKSAIAHTRWATHGKITQINAHPQNDGDHSIALVHNGIIENYLSIRTGLEKQGILFTSDTDTEVISQLISSNYSGDLVEALRKSLPKLQGSYAFAFIHKDHPETIVAVADGCPLVIGIDTDSGDTLLASDMNAFAGRSLELFFLSDGEIVEIRKDGTRVTTKNGDLITKNTIKSNLEEYQQTLGKHAHFMHKEIFEQPEAISRSLAGRFNPSSQEIELDMDLSAEVCNSLSQILILACGSSYHAGCIAAIQLESLTGISTRVEIASEFRYAKVPISKSTLVIIISQSGETADTLAALQTAKASNVQTLGICNVPHSTMTREVDDMLLLHAGVEVSVCCTKAFTCQLSLLYMITLHIAKMRGLEKQRYEHLFRQLLLIPKHVHNVLAMEETIKEMAIKYSHYSQFFFIGRRDMYFTAMEAALKLKEISYINAQSYPAGEMKHGPIALIDQSLPTIAFCGHRETLSKTMSNMIEVKTRGGPLLAFSFENSLELDSITEDCIQIPGTIPDEYAPIPFSVASQLFAYHLADTLGCEIDKPKNLAKSVTVE